MSLETLRQAYPWPAEIPKDVEPFDFGWIIDAHEDVFRHYMKKSKIILEIGTFCGKSAKLALSSSPPDSTVICIDPWFMPMDKLWYEESNVKVPEVIPHSWDLFRVNMEPYKDRIIPIREVSQIALFDVKEHGVEPDIVYIDGWHQFHAVITDLELVHRLFPKAQIFGDDWSLVNDVSDVAYAVKYWTGHKGFGIQVHKDRVFRIIKP